MIQVSEKLLDIIAKLFFSDSFSSKLREYNKNIDAYSKFGYLYLFYLLNRKYCQDKLRNANMIDPFMPFFQKNNS